MLPGWHRCTDLHSLGAPSGRRVLAVLCSPRFCLSQGKAGLQALLGYLGYPGSCAAGPVLPGLPLLQRIGLSHLCEPAGLPDWLVPNALEGFSSPALYRYCPVVCGELSPGRPYSSCDSRNLEASLPLLGFCLISMLSYFPSGKTPAWIFKDPASRVLGFPVLEAFAAPL